MSDSSKGDSSSDGKLILALDLGTSSSRAMLYDAQAGAAVDGAVAQIKHEPVHSPDGGSTLDADALVEELVSCAEKALATGKNAARVAGVGISTFWHSTVGIDAKGAAVTPVLLWSDLRSAGQVAVLRQHMDAPAYTQRTGCPLHTSYLPGRLLWLREARPDWWSRCVRFVSPGEYLFGKLFGFDRVTCSLSMASGTGLLNEAASHWDAATLRHLPGVTSDRLSPLGDAPQIGLVEPYKSRLSALPADTPWFPALGDGACSNIGCGAVAPGQVALMIGTSGALRVVVASAKPPPVPTGLFRYRIDGDRSLFGGAISNGGSIWAFLERTLRFPGVADDAVEAAFGTLAPDSHGLTILPFYAGERAPLWRDDLRATIHGLGAGTTSLEIARAHLEAVALRFAAVREALQPIAPPASQPIVGTGAGLLSSPVWAQIIADALGASIALSAEEQASSRGAALWARERLGLGSIAEAPPIAITRTVAPNEANTEIYRKARERQEALLRKLEG